MPPRSAAKRKTLPKGRSITPGFKNYGQQRSAEVHSRNVARKAAKRGVQKPLKNDNTTGKSDAVAAANQRAGGRLAALGGKVPGVNGANGYTKAERQRILKARGRQKFERARKRGAVLKKSRASGV